MWNCSKPIPIEEAKGNRIGCEGAWAGASWNGILNVGMYSFKQRRNDKTCLFWTIKEYDPQWKEIAERELEFITNNFAKFPWFRDIQHIGSTSIVGMAAKPVIDIFLGVNDSDNHQEIYEALTSLGYTEYPKGSTFFIKDASGVEFVSVAVVSHNSLRWKSRILFRDYFREHPAAIQDYINLKKSLMSKGLSGVEYVMEKGKYMYSIYLKQGLTFEEMVEACAVDKRPDDMSTILPKREELIDGRLVYADNWRIR